MSIRKLKARGIGRLELLAWLNEFLETDYTKVRARAEDRWQDWPASWKN